MIQAIPILRARLSACRGVLVDSNILLDIATKDPNWSDWSGGALAECAEHTTLIINPIISAEVSIGYTTIEALDAALPNPVSARTPTLGCRLSWPGSASCCTAAAEDGGPRLCRTSTLARTPPSDTLLCSRVMLRAIAAIFRPSKSSLPQNPRCDAVAKPRCAFRIAKATRRIRRMPPGASAWFQMAFSRVFMDPSSMKSTMVDSLDCLSPIDIR